MRPRPTTTSAPTAPTDPDHAHRPRPADHPDDPRRARRPRPADRVRPTCGSATTDDSATLSWDGDPTAHYEILRGEAGVRIATTAGNTFTDGGLARNVPYVYSVRGPGGVTRRSPSSRAGTPTSRHDIRHGADHHHTQHPTRPAPSGAAPRQPAGQGRRPAPSPWPGTATRHHLRGAARGGGGADRHGEGHQLHRHRVAAEHAVRVLGPRRIGQTTPQVTLRIS